MHGTCTTFLYKRYNKRCYCCSNSTRTLKFKYTFINTFPSSYTCREYAQTNLLIPHQVKAPTSSEENIETFRSFFCTKRLRSCIDKNSCCSLTLKYSKQRLSRYPNRNHVTSNSSISTRRIYNSISPEVRTPANCSITQQVTSKNTKNS
jgi:hypothetical protein